MKPMLNERFEVTLESGEIMTAMHVFNVTPTHVHLRDGRYAVTIPRAKFAAAAKRLHDWSDDNRAGSIRCMTCGIVVEVPTCEGVKR